jgi:hypothetical protein
MKPVLRLPLRTWVIAITLSGLLWYGLVRLAIGLST